MMTLGLPWSILQQGQMGLCGPVVFRGYMVFVIQFVHPFLHLLFCLSFCLWTLRQSYVTPKGSL